MKINTKKASTAKAIVTSSLIQGMKEHLSSCSLPEYKKTSSATQKDLSYIFHIPKVENKFPKEKKISEALNEIGIFQINIGILMKDYNF